MRVLEAGRRAGKTHDVMKALEANPRAVAVVFSEAERRRVLEEYEVAPSQVVACSNPDGLRGLHPSELYVDNADLVFATLYGRVPAAITVSA